MLRRLIALAAGGVIALGVIGGVQAHPGHGSCAGGVPGVVEAGLAPIPAGPGFGTDFVKPIATAGAAKETVALLHSVYCAPK